MRRIFGSLFVLTALVPLACNGRNAGTAVAVEAEAPSSSVATVDSSPSASASVAASPAPPPVHHRGIAGLFFRAALDGDLADDEKATLDKLEEPLRNDPGPHHESAAFHGDLVASTKAGRIDAAKLQTDEAALNKAYASREDDQATALRGLHDALSPERRKAVVDAIRAMQAAHDRPPASLSAAGATEAVVRRVDRMKTQLGLDADQQQQVSALLLRDQPSPAAIQARFEANKKQMDALLTAFEKDAFDAKKVDLAPFPGRKPSDGMERQAKYIGQLLPILRPEQRERLATMMDHPHEHGHGPMDSIAEPLDPSEGRGH